MSSVDDLCVNTIRTLSMDAVQKANSGHPGTAMAMAPVVYDVWQRHLRFDPGDPIWPNRDRFGLSIGHASMLLYSMLHLTGVKGACIGMTSSGASAPLAQLQQKFGFTTEHVVAVAKDVLLRSSRPSLT